MTSAVTFEACERRVLMAASTSLHVNAGGAQSPASAEADVNVTDGSIDLSFQGTTGDAIVSGIVLVPTDVPDAALPYSWLALSDDARQTQALSNLRAVGQQIITYVND